MFFFFFFLKAISRNLSQKDFISLNKGCLGAVDYLLTGATKGVQDPLGVPCMGLLL